MGGSQTVHPHGLHGVLLRFGAHDVGKVYDPVDGEMVMEQGCDLLLVAHVAARHRDLGREICDDLLVRFEIGAEYALPVLQKVANDVRADEAGSTGNQEVHESPVFFWPRREGTAGRMERFNKPTVRRQVKGPWPVRKGNWTRVGMGREWAS